MSALTTTASFHASNFDIQLPSTTARKALAALRFNTLGEVRANLAGKRCEDTPVCDGVPVAHLCGDFDAARQRSSYPLLAGDASVHDRVLTHLLALGSFAALDLFKRDELIAALQSRELAAVLTGLADVAYLKTAPHSQEALREICYYLSVAVKAELELMPIDNGRSVVIGNIDGLRKRYRAEYVGSAPSQESVFALNKDQIERITQSPLGVMFLAAYEIYTGKGIVPTLLRNEAICSATHQELLAMAHSAIKDPYEVLRHPEQICPTTLTRLQSPTIKTIFFLAGNSALTTERCLRSYFNSLRLFRHIPPEIVILEDSEGAEAKKKHELYQALATEFRLTISLFAAPHKRHLVDQICSNPEVGAAPDELASRYFGQRCATTQRNFASLLSRGSYMMVDTDSFAGTASPISYAEGLIGRRAKESGLSRRNEFSSYITAQQVLDYLLNGSGTSVDCSEFHTARDFDAVIRDLAQHGKLSSQQFANSFTQRLSNVLSTEGESPELCYFNGMPQGEALVRIPVDLMTVHGDLLRKPVADQVRKGLFIKEPRDLDPTAKVVASFANCLFHTPGSRTRAFTNYIDSGSVAALRGEQHKTMMRVGQLPTSFLQNESPSTVTCTVISGWAPGTLLSEPALDSYQLNHQLRGADRSSWTARTFLRLDHQREPLTAAKRAAPLTQTEADQFMKDHVAEDIMSAAFPGNGDYVRDIKWLAFNLSAPWCLLHYQLTQATRERDGRHCEELRMLISAYEKALPRVFTFSWEDILFYAPLHEGGKSNSDDLTADTHTNVISAQRKEVGILIEKRHSHYLQRAIDEVIDRARTAQKLAPLLKTITKQVREEQADRLFTVIGP